MKFKTGLRCLIVSLTIILTSCSLFPKKPILLGAIYNLHGSLSSLDIPSSNGLKLAIDEINREGGINGRQIQLLLKDGYTNPDSIKAATQYLIDRKVVTIIGFSDSDQVLYADKLIVKSNIPYITSGSTAPILVKNIPKNLFLGCFGDNVQAAAGAEFAKTRLNSKHVFLITNQNMEYTRYLAQYFKNSWLVLGGSVIGDLCYRGNASDSITIIQSLKREKANYEVIYLAAGPPDVGHWIRLIRKAGITQPIIGGDGYDTPLLLKYTNDYADNIYYSTHAWMSQNGSNVKMKEFYIAYHKEFGVDPENSFAALAYDAAMLFADAARRAKKINPKYLLQAIEKTSDFTGITGRLNYLNGSHIPVKEVMIVGIKKQKYALEAVIMPEYVPIP